MGTPMPPPYGPLSSNAYAGNAVETRALLAKGTAHIHPNNPCPSIGEENPMQLLATTPAHGHTPLSLACSSSPKPHEDEICRPECVTLLIDAGAPLDAVVLRNGGGKSHTSHIYSRADNVHTSI